MYRGLPREGPDFLYRDVAYAGVPHNVVRLRGRCAFRGGGVVSAGREGSEQTYAAYRGERTGHHVVVHELCVLFSRRRRNHLISSGCASSSQQTAVEAWIEGFRSQAPNATVAYNPSGSGAGVSTFLTGSTVWAGSDKALSAEEIEQSKSVCASGTAFDVPVYVSPIAVAFNLDGISTAGKHVNMDAATIAKVFNGEITRWNDPAITEQNPGLDLPNLTITVVHRSDKSGTTLNFVSYLKDVAPSAWPHDLSENWPNEVGQGAKGTSGVVSTIKQANGTIGYADFSQVGDLGTIAVKVGDDYTPISADAASKVIAEYWSWRVSRP